MVLKKLAGMTSLKALTERSKEVKALPIDDGRGPAKLVWVMVKMLMAE